LNSSRCLGAFGMTKLRGFIVNRARG
jgi:hypothetical protein